MKSNFGKLKWSKNVIINIFDFSKFLANFKSQIYQISKFRVSKIAKNDISELFELAKMISRKIRVVVKLSNFNKVKP